MSQIVVDTDVASYIFNWHSLAQQYVDALRGSDLILSFMSVAELRMGAMSAGWGSQRRLLLERFVRGFEIFYPDTTSARFGRGSVLTPEPRAERSVPRTPGLPRLRWRWMCHSRIVGISRTFGICGCCLCNDQCCLDHPGTGIVRNRLDVFPNFVQINICSRSPREFPLDGPFDCIC